MSSSGSTPTVSVVITTYYRNELLREAIRSVQRQDHPSIELIVVDGSEEEHASPVVEDVPELEYVPLEEDEGPHGSRSVGAQEASGSYVQFLDDDDLLHPDKLSRQLELFTDRVGVVHSGVEIAETGEVLEPTPDQRGEVLEKALRIELWPPACTSTLLIRRDVLQEILPLRNRHGCDDDGMMIELAQRTEFDYVDAPLVEKREETEYSVSGPEAAVDGRLRILDMYSELYDRQPEDVRNGVLFDLYRLRARSRLIERRWSAGAIVDYARAAYYAPDGRSKRLAICGASLFGRPGVRLGNRVVRSISGRTTPR